MIKQKIQDLLDELNQGLVEREAAVKAILLSALASENMVLIGPPGTGKSMVARRVAEVFQANQETQSESDYFEYLLTKFSTPEEIFGPLSITELKADRFKRNTTGYLPSVRMAFLDEIFKASSSILNSLLTILNERVYHNGAEAQRVPLMSLIAASNELPTGQEELAALYDRFLIRSFVDYVSADNMVLLFENKSPEPLKNRLTHKDIAAIQRSASSVKIPNEIAEAVQRIWTEHKDTFKEDAREYLSDRRLKKIVQLLRISAATNDRQEVNLSDVVLLKDCLWNHQENTRKVKDIIFNVLKKYSKDISIDGCRNKQSKRTPEKNSKSSTKITVKGFVGSGTKNDPLLVESIEHLADLSRPDVGVAGYYFKQTKNIDCSNLSSWNSIEFNGHYDGAGNEIKFQKTGVNYFQVFKKIHAKSEVSGLCLIDCILIMDAKNITLLGCQSNVNLVEQGCSNCSFSYCSSSGYIVRGKALNSIFVGVESKKSLVSGDVENSKISLCWAGSSLVKGNVIKTSIVDCLVDIDVDSQEFFGGESQGGIAKKILDGSTVERCYVSGVLNANIYSSGGLAGIAGTVFTSKIIDSVVGEVHVAGSWGVSAKARVSFNVDNVSLIKNTVSTDLNAGSDGQVVSNHLLTQRYFENTAGWDFENIWQWDSKRNAPILRAIGCAASLDKSDSDLSKPQNMVDLLSHEISMNVWFR